MKVITPTPPVMSVRAAFAPGRNAFAFSKRLDSSGLNRLATRSMRTYCSSTLRQRCSGSTRRGACPTSGGRPIVPGRSKLRSELQGPHEGKGDGESCQHEADEVYGEESHRILMRGWVRAICSKAGSHTTVQGAAPF